MISRDALVDPNSSDHVVAITELREQVATLQKQLTGKDNQLLSKEKQVSFFLPLATLFVEPSNDRILVLRWLR